MANLRTFIALDLPAHAPATLERIQRRLIARLATDAVRWAPVASIHLTLIFLGDVETSRIDNLRTAINDACHSPALRLALDQFGCFPSITKPNVIWLGLRGDLTQLGVLHQRLSAATEPFAEKHETRGFHPHLTLGRLKPNARRRGRRIGEQLQQEALIADCAWTANSVTLFRSELTPKGSIYTPLERVALTH